MRRLHSLSTGALGCGIERLRCHLACVRHPPGTQCAEPMTRVYNHSMAEAEFTYDVAISFLAKDEHVANEINDMLSPRFRTFLYSKQQEALAGRDGDAVFRQVFLKQARTVLVLYRTGWGETPFTQIEQEAIRDRAHRTNWRFSLFVALEDNPTMPEFLSERKLYYGLPRFGIAGVAGAVESLVVEAGGEARPETVADVAARADRELRFLADRANYFRTEAGVQAADNEFAFITEAIVIAAHQITETRGNLPLKATGIRTVSGEPCAYVTGPFRSLSVVWHREYANDLKHSYIDVCVWKGAAPMVPGIHLKEARRLMQVRYSFGVDRTMALHTRALDNDRLLTRGEFVDKCLGLLIEHLLDEQRARFRQMQ